MTLHDITWELIFHLIRCSQPTENTGVQLLRPDQEKVLDVIAADRSHDVVSCCKRVLKKWLETSTNATWNELIRALRRPSVELDCLANQLERMLSIERKIL